MKDFVAEPCSASNTNRSHLKRIAKVKPIPIKKPARVLSDKERRARNVETVQAYRARKYSATPSDVDRKLIRLIYENCPAGYEVDHIVAISEGGPHHHNNLQYLPAIVNRKKNRTQNYDRSTILRWQDIVKIDENT